MFGAFNGLSLDVRVSAPGGQPQQLEFPPAYPPTTRARYEPSTAIKQFSSGRSKVLGLADDGKVWCWGSTGGWASVLIRSVHVDLIDHEVLEVQAGKAGSYLRK